MTRALWIATFAAIALVFSNTVAAADSDKDTYDKDTTLKEAAAFFGESTEGLAKVIEKAFADHGRPNGYIKGEEVSGAIVLGLRYGNGTITLKNGGTRTVHWTGPSIGFDAGANAAKVFVLVYNLPAASAIYQRFPAVEGSFYYVAGAGINYQKKDKIVLAPIRLGVGLRGGVNIGYLSYSREKTWMPF